MPMSSFIVAGLVNITVHKGLFPPSSSKSSPTCWRILT
jgi:hypothetical protein